MGFQSIKLQDVKSLSLAHRAALKKNNFKDLSDIVLTPPAEIAKKLRTSLSDAQSIIESVCREVASISFRVVRIDDGTPDDKFTTGDALLDRIIGGGIKTGMIWELVGESGSGKTQLALQLSLLVQVRPMLGGLSGSACYLSTNAKLSTKRLNQIIEDNPLLSPSVCSLSDIHTLAVPTIELLLHTLTTVFPALQDKLRTDDARKPIRLVIIDSISALFHTSGKPSGSTLFERSRALTELSRVMHGISARNNIAFIITNDVSDVFNDYYTSQEGASKGDIIYRDQARWFNSAHSIPSESAKEACLGLVWANQVNARMMLTRTNRRRHLDDPYPLAKRRQVDGGLAVAGSSQNFVGSADDSILLRRLSVVFSSVSPPGSVDFVVTNAGVSAVPDESVNTPLTWNAIEDPKRKCAVFADDHSHSGEPSKAVDFGSDVTGGHPSQHFVNARMAPAAVEVLSSEASSETLLEVIPSTYPEEVDKLDDEGLYWEEIDDLSHSAAPDLDFDDFERSQIEEDIQNSQAVNSRIGHG